MGNHGVFNHPRRPEALHLFGVFYLMHLKVKIFLLRVQFFTNIFPPRFSDSYSEKHEREIKTSSEYSRKLQQSNIML